MNAAKGKIERPDFFIWLIFSFFFSLLVGLIIKLIRTAGDNLGKFLLGDKKYTGRRYGGGAITYSTIIFLAFMFYWLFYPSIAKEEKEEEGES